MTACSDVMPATPACGCAQVDRLAAAVRLRVPRPVDRDEVAVVLESTGFTDEVATRGYRQAGVFALAEQVLRRACPGWAPSPARARADWRLLGRAEVMLARLVAMVALGAVGWRYGWAAALPVLPAVPLAELLVAWHGGQARYGFASYDERALLVRHLRAVGWRALLALVPPLLVASALLAVAGHLPAGRPLAEVTAAHAAAGVLSAGWYGLLLLLAARHRLLGGLAVAGGCVGLVPVGGLWTFVGGYVLGLVLVALALFDPRRFTGS